MTSTTIFLIVLTVFFAIVAIGGIIFLCVKSAKDSKEKKAEKAAKVAEKVKAEEARKAKVAAEEEARKAKAAADEEARKAEAEANKKAIADANAKADEAEKAAKEATEKSAALEKAVSEVAEKQAADDAEKAEKVRQANICANSAFIDNLIAKYREWDVKLADVKREIDIILVERCELNEECPGDLEAETARIRATGNYRAKSSGVAGKELKSYSVTFDGEEAEVDAASEAHEAAKAALPESAAVAKNAIKAEKAAKGVAKDLTSKKADVYAAITVLEAEKATIKAEMEKIKNELVETYKLTEEELKNFLQLD